jgi:hypothetical protein
MDTLPKFIADYTGQAVSYDGIKANTGQCEQLVLLYWKDVYGFKAPAIPGAYQLWTNATVLKSFEQIAIGEEQPGDVAVWAPNSDINSSEYGHTDIVVKPGFLGFDSNWGGVTTTVNGIVYPAAHEVQHSYLDVMGFLRWKGEPMNNEEPINEGDFDNIATLFGDPVSAFNQAPNWNKEFYGAIEPRVKALQAQITALQQQLASASNPTVLSPGDYRVET